MDITVKNIPEPIYSAIKREAKRNGRSLNAEIIQTLEAKVAEAERRARLGRMLREFDRIAASIPPLSDSAPLIRRDRERH